MPWNDIARRDYSRRGPCYASDLSDREWALIVPFLPSPRRVGRPKRSTCCLEERGEVQVLKLGEIVLIHDLKRQGLSVSAIARRLGLDRKTVRRHLERGLEASAYGPRAPQATLIEAFENYLAARVAAYPELSGKRLLREVREMGYAGSRSGSVCLNSFEGVVEWIAALVTPPPGCASAG